MKYSLRSLMLFADPGMGNGIGFLVIWAVVGGSACLAAVGIIFGFKWFLTRYWSSLTSAKTTIRELLMLTAMVAVFFAWFVDHRRQAKEIELLKHDLRGFYGPLFRVVPNSSAPGPNPPKP